MYKQPRESVKQYFAGINFTGLEFPGLLQRSSSCSLTWIGKRI